MFSIARHGEDSSALKAVDYLRFHDDLKPESKHFRLLDLPRELRVMIFRELLTPEISTLVRTSFDLTPAILRVNKQFQAEVSSILYRGNCWVLISTDYEFSWEDIGVPVVACPDSNPDMIPIRIDFCTGGNRDHGVCFQATAYDMPFLCYWMTQEQRRHVIANVTINASISRFPSHKERLYECLQDLHRSGHVSINIINSTTPDAMRWKTSLLTSMQSFSDRLQAYQLRGDREAARGNFQEAALIYTNGYGYIMWGLRKKMISMLSEKENKQRLTLVLAHVLAEIKSGKFEIGFWICNWIMRRWRLPDAHRASARHYSGLACLAANRNNLAAYHFFQALIIRPGFLAVDKEIDELEKKLMVEFTETTSMALRNIRTVLTPYRHNKPLENVDSKIESYYNITGADEKQRILRSGWQLEAFEVLERKDDSPTDCPLSKVSIDLGAYYKYIPSDVPGLRGYQGCLIQ